MPLIVRAFPILPGKEDQVRQFAQDLRTTRAADAAAFYDRMGVAKESWHLQETAHGSWVIAVTDVVTQPIEEAARDYAGSVHGFDRWFKEQVKAVSGIDPETTPLGPPTQCIFDSHAA